MDLPWPCAPHPFAPLTTYGPDGLPLATDWCGHIPGGGLPALASGLVGDICAQLADHLVHRPPTDGEVEPESAEHRCVGLTGGEECHDGRVYGYCPSERCDGACEWLGDCGCPCHQEPA